VADYAVHEYILRADPILTKYELDFVQAIADRNGWSRPS
jgi:hypothetical protein